MPSKAITYILKHQLQRKISPYELFYDKGCYQTVFPRWHDSVTMAACIRGPRSVQGSVDSLHKANNVQYKSIIQASKPNHRILLLCRCTHNITCIIILNSQIYCLSKLLLRVFYLLVRQFLGRILIAVLLGRINNEYT